MCATPHAHRLGGRDPPPVSAIPRRTCPACARRYAGLVSADCPICRGLGVLPLGAAALHAFEPDAVARAVELYLEHAAQAATERLDLGDRRDALEVATDELRAAGVLASSAAGVGTPAHPSGPGGATSPGVVEVDARRLAHAAGRTLKGGEDVTLALPPLTDLQGHRYRDGRTPTASANGHRAALAVIADPIDPLGPDVAELAADRFATDHQAEVIAQATPHAAHQRRQAHRP